MEGGSLKVTKANMELLIEAGKATQFGPDWPGKRCLAKTRSGTPCQKAAIRGKTRCQLHGGTTPQRKMTATPVQRVNYFQEIQKIKRWAQANGFRTTL